MELKTVLAKVASLMATWRALTEAGRGILRLRMREWCFLKSPNRGRQVPLLQPTAKSVQWGVPPAELIRHNRGEPSHSTNERSGEGHDGKDCPHGLHWRCWQQYHSSPDLHWLVLFSVHWQSEQNPFWLSRLRETQLHTIPFSKHVATWDIILTVCAMTSCNNCVPTCYKYLAKVSRCSFPLPPSPKITQ